MVELFNKDLKVVIDAGELTSFRKKEHEFIHQKSDPGWGNSDIEMFPIIGPTADAGYRVHVPRGNAIQDQHGLLREMEYDLVEKTETSAKFAKNYPRGTVVMNSKFPERSSAQRLIWPFEFRFEKHFSISENELTIQFVVSGEKDMPFMLGYHPAFKLHSDQPTIKTADREIDLREVLDAGSRALEVANLNSIVLQDQAKLQIDTEGFGNFMLWTEVNNMVCIEPVTYYPYTSGQGSLHEGFMHLGDSEMIFTVRLQPL